MIPRVEAPVVAGFWRCGCIPIYLAVVVEGRHQAVADMTLYWPREGLETRIVSRSKAFATRTACHRCAGIPQQPIDLVELGRLQDVRQEVLNIIQVMQRISGR